MKKAKRISALAVLFVIGAALTLTGCWKDKLSEDNDLQFSAAYSAGTKAIYGDDVAGRQQILWTGSDDVRISSDYAVTLLGRRFSDYDVIPQTGDSDATKGKIRRKATIIGGVEDSGLRWIDNASGTASFWSVYPASAMTDSDLQSISVTIPSSTSLQEAVKQPSGNVVKVLDPVNGSYPMVAYTSGVNANSNLVKLEYYPAFTAFQVTLVNDSQERMTLNYCALTSTTDALCGSFTAPIEDLAKDSPVTTSVAVTGGGNTVTTGINQVLEAGQAVTFNLFCLPTDLTNLTFECNFTSDAQGTQSKVLALKQNDAYINFAACKQHRINLNFSGAGAMEVEITPVIAVVLANAFKDLYDVNGAGELVDKQGNPVDPNEVYQQILNVREVVITEDHGVSLVNYVSGMYAFVNLESLTIDNSVSQQANSINTVNIEGLQHFKTLDIVSAPAIQHVSVIDCPLTEYVAIESRSLQTVTLENLTILKEISVGEDEANSNLHTFTMINCPDLEIAHFGQIGALENLDLSNCAKLETLEIELAYQLKNLNLTGCSSLKTLYINNAESIKYIDLDDCPLLESIILVNPQEMLAFEYASTTLHTLKFIGTQGAQHMITMTLNTPALTTVEMTNNQSLANLTLSNLPSAINSLQMLVPAFSQNGSRALTNLSLTNCSGFTDISIDSAQSIAQMHFDSCSALRSITLYGNSASNVWNNPPTTTIVATKRNCPNLSSTYTVNNWGTIKTYPFTNQ